MSKLETTPIYSSPPVMEGDKMRKIDLEVSEDLNFYRTMESVGTRTADFIQYWIELSIDKHILLASGKGNNGGNALTAGRILAGRGYKNISVLMSHSQDAMKGVAAEQFELFLKFGGKVTTFEQAMKLPADTLVIDGLLGTGISRSPAGAVGDLIKKVNDLGFKILSCDLPSGLNHLTGQVHEPCIRATWTLNYHVLKTGQSKVMISLLDFRV